jgi:hypothetical protein
MTTNCQTARTGGRDMTAPPATHSAHLTRFPQTTRAARRAARQWFTGAPTLTLAAWRDQARERHCAGLPFEPRRNAAFNGAYELEVAAIIAEGFTNRKADGQETRAGVPAPIERAISAFGYANRHPEDARGIEWAHGALVTAILSGGAHHE